MSAAWGHSSLPVTCDVLWCLVSQAVQTSTPTAVATIPPSFPRDFQNYEFEEKYQVKNILYPFSIPVSIPERLVLSCSLSCAISSVQFLSVIKLPFSVQTGLISFQLKRNYRYEYEGKLGLV